MDCSADDDLYQKPESIDDMVTHLAAKLLSPFGVEVSTGDGKNADKKATAAGCTMEVTVMKLGEDFQICLAGGEKPHIGCVVQAVPRESLTGDGSWSATSSVWNRTGHKDEVLCRMLAEKSVVPAVP